MQRQFAVLCLFAASAIALLPSPNQEDSDFVLHSDVRLVLLDVSVTDHSGAFVSGLSKSNFTIFENGRQQPITVFNNQEVPVTIGLVVDSSFSMTPKRYEVLRAAQQFLDRSNPLDEVFVLNFNDEVRSGLPAGVQFSSNPRQLHDALYRGKPAGKTALYDAVIGGLNQIRNGTRSKRTLIVITDGADTASKHSRGDLLRQAEDSLTTIYTIGLYEPDSRDQDPALLRKLARVSGGEALFPASVSQMDEVCSRIARDIRLRYTVGYRPHDPAGSESSLRQIRLSVRGPDNTRLIARARTSYRYDHSSEDKPIER